MAFISSLSVSTRYPSFLRPQTRTPLTQCPQTFRWRAARMTAISQHKNLQAAWPSFAERMKNTGEVPPLQDWHELLDVCEAGGDSPSQGLWVLNLMRETGRKPTAVTYEKMLKICVDRDDREAAFHLVEHMFKDKVLLGDVELPDGMEEILRKILPPEAFE